MKHIALRSDRLDPEEFREFLEFEGEGSPPLTPEAEAVWTSIVAESDAAELSHQQAKAATNWANAFCFIGIACALFGFRHAPNGNAVVSAGFAVGIYLLCQARAMMLHENSNAAVDVAHMAYELYQSGVDRLALRLALTRAYLG